MRWKPGPILFSVLLPFLLGSCSGDGAGDAEPGGVSLPDPVVLTSLRPSASDPAVITGAGTVVESEEVATTSSTTVAGFPRPPSYDVVARTTGEDGDTLIVLLDPDSYTSLSDIDLENIVADVYDRFSPVFEAHIVDDPTAADRIAEDGPAAVTASALAEHYLLRLEEGYRMVFLGPYEEFGTASLGS